MGKYRFLIIILFFLLITNFVHSKIIFKTGIISGNFSINDSRYDNVYKKNNFFYGGIIAVSPIRKFDLICNFKTFSKNGTNEFSDAHFKLYSLSLGVRYSLLFRRISPYIGSGINLVKYEDTTPFYEVSETKTGYYFGVGSYFKITKIIYFDLNGRYNFLKVSPIEIEVDLGGLEIAIGIGVKF